MGYTTTFDGEFKVEPPLNDAERTYLRKFAETRRMDRAEGPYFVDGPGFSGQQATPGVRDFNRPPAGQPGLWCQWVPTEDGSAITWDGDEKFYPAREWIEYLIDHFLRPNARASACTARYGIGGQFAEFTFDHILNGEVEAVGEDYDDHWLLVVKDNQVSTRQGRIVYEDSE